MGVLFLLLILCVIGQKIHPERQFFDSCWDWLWAWPAPGGWPSLGSLPPWFLPELWFLCGAFKSKLTFLRIFCAFFSPSGLSSSLHTSLFSNMYVLSCLWLFSVGKLMEMLACHWLEISACIFRPSAFLSSLMDKLKLSGHFSLVCTVYQSLLWPEVMQWRKRLTPLSKELSLQGEVTEIGICLDYFPSLKFKRLFLLKSGWFSWSPFFVLLP